MYLFWTFSRKLNFRNFDLSGPKGSNSSVVKVKQVFDQLYGTNISKLEHSKLEGLLNRILSKLNDSDGIPKASRQYIDKMKQINSTKPFQGDNISDSILKRMNEYLSALSKDDRITSDRNLTKDIMKYLLILNTTANVKVQETNTTRVSKGKLTSPVLSPTTKRHERLAHTLSTSTDTISTAVQPFCDTNKLLIGKINIKPDVTVNQVKDIAALKRVKKGGTYIPEGCRPRDSVAIIIPYRDRQKHLEIFVNHMHAFLQRQQLQYGSFVAEIARPTTFNRGLLANVGFLAAQNTGLYNCYVIHDVDLIPTNDRNVYNCSGDFRHLAAANTKFGNKVPYNEYAGGVIALREDIYETINGFSNLYFGWGGEDDDVWNRAKAEHYKMSRPDRAVGSFVALPHGRDALNPPNPERFKLVGSGPGRRHHDGLNSLNYQQLSITQQELYTLVYVKVDQKEVLQTNVVRIINGLQIYESDLKTLGEKRVVNDKIVTSYFWLLQDNSNNSVFSVKTTHRYMKETPFLDITNKTDYVFLPSKVFGHWHLAVIFHKQQSIAYIDPTRNYSQKDIETIRRAYEAQFHVVLSDRTEISKAVTHDQNESNSGILVMMYARRIVEGKSLSFQQSEIVAARTEIETAIREK